MTLPYALGCPSCPHYEIVSTEDSAASMSELYRHISAEHAGYDPAATYELMAKAHEMTKDEVAAR